jgi:two-component system, LytTR family, response regulator
MKGGEAEMTEVEEKGSAEVSVQCFGRDDFVFLYDRAKSWVVRVREIEMLEANGNDTMIYIGDRKILMRRLIGRCERELDGLIFFRAGRSCIVNLNFVKRVEMADAKRMMFVMANGREVTLSRARSVSFRRERGL